MRRCNVFANRTKTVDLFALDAFEHLHGLGRKGHAPEWCGGSCFHYEYAGGPKRFPRWDETLHLISPSEHYSIKAFPPLCYSVTIRILNTKPLAMPAPYTAIKLGKSLPNELFSPF